MKLRSINYLVAFLMVATIFTQVAEAQDREQVVLKYNEGVELAQAGEDLAAIEVFEETLELTEAASDEFEDIRTRARTQIPQLYFRHAADLFRSGNIESAINAFEETISIAEQYGDENTKARSEGNLPRLYLSLGNGYYRNEQLDAALDAYNSALELNPNYPRAIYQKGLVFRQQNDLEGAMEQFDAAIDMSLNTGDMDMVDRASDAAKDYLVYVGANAIEDENFSTAVELLNRAATYDDSSAEVNYRLAEVHNNLGNWDQAINYANQAIELEDGGQVDRAKIWFELGIAFKNQENEPQACEAFQNASYGSFQSAAEHELEYELNCAQASR